MLYKNKTRKHSSRIRTTCSSSYLFGGVCLSSCWDPPGVGLETPLVWAWRPPRCGPGDPSGCGPGDPSGCGPGDPSGCGPGDPPQVWPWRPWQCGPGDPPRPDPSTSPLGMGLETCKACWDTTPTGDLLQGMLGYHPPVNRIIDRCKNITLPQTSFTDSNARDEKPNLFVFSA